MRRSRPSELMSAVDAEMAKDCDSSEKGLLAYD
jgi:hypothetical protein